jgi:hypothetical protein
LWLKAKPNCLRQVSDISARHFLCLPAHALRLRADTEGMKHIRDAQKLIQSGNGPAALEIIDNLLELAPRNCEALRLKAGILDQWGHFDTSFQLLRDIATIEGPDSTIVDDYEDRLREEREAMVFSEITPEGRWYFAFPRAQIWISMYGFLGCAVFLLMSSSWASKGSEALAELLLAFTLFVLIPWVGLIITHFRGIKKILVGIEGIKVCTAFSSRIHRWSEVTSAVVEYDPNVKNNHLVLRIFGKTDPKIPLETLNIAAGKSTVRARRHFVRSVLAYIDCVLYLAKPHSEFAPIEQTQNVEPSTPLQDTNKAA